MTDAIAIISSGYERALDAVGQGWDVVVTDTPRNNWTAVKPAQTHECQAAKHGWQGDPEWCPWCGGVRCDP